MFVRREVEAIIPLIGAILLIVGVVWKNPHWMWLWVFFFECFYMHHHYVGGYAIIVRGSLGLAEWIQGRGHTDADEFDVLDLDYNWVHCGVPNIYCWLLHDGVERRKLTTTSFNFTDSHKWAALLWSWSTYDRINQVLQLQEKMSYEIIDLVVHIFFSNWYMKKIWKRYWMKPKKTVGLTSWMGPFHLWFILTENHRNLFCWTQSANRSCFRYIFNHFYLFFFTFQVYRSTLGQFQSNQISQKTFKIESPCD